VPALRSLLTYGAVLIVIFAVAVSAGYVYEHDPQRDLVTVSMSPAASGDSSLISGNVVSTYYDIVLVNTEFGVFEVPLADVMFEELRPIEDPGLFPEGTALNLGGESSPTERVISGIVLLTPEVLP
jgi:hypothetical protein